jgi:hypothetical protein
VSAVSGWRSAETVRNNGLGMIDLVEVAANRSNGTPMNRH